MVLAGILAACGGAGGDTAKPGALPRDRGPRLGVTVDAPLTNPARLDRRCDLFDPARTGLGGPPVFVTRCGPVTYAKFTDGAAATREYAHILTRAGTGLHNTKGLPDCRRRTGLLGPLPTASSAAAPGTPPGIARVACLDLGDRTAVVWLDSGTALLGVRTVADDDHRTWRGYGPAWPPFTAGVTPATAPPP